MSAIRNLAIASAFVALGSLAVGAAVAGGTKDESRHPSISGAGIPLAAVAVEAPAAPAAGRLAKGDRLDGAGCAKADWPYVPANCLVHQDGRAAAPVRNVTVERRIGEAFSVLEQAALATAAAD